MRSEGEGRLSGTPVGRDAGGGGRTGAPPVAREQGLSRWMGPGADKLCAQPWSQTQRTTFTTVASTFRLPKIPFTDWLSLIKRMSPVLLARYRTHPATWGSVWKLCRGDFPMGQLLFACILPILPVPGSSGSGAPLKCPSTVQAQRKEGKLHPLPVLASLLPSKHGERLPPLSSSTFQCKDLANFFYE